MSTKTKAQLIFIGVATIILIGGSLFGRHVVAQEETAVTVTSSPTPSTTRTWIPPADAEQKISDAAASAEAAEALRATAAAEVSASRSSATSTARSAPTAAATSAPTRTTEAPIAGLGGEDGDPGTLSLVQAIALTQSGLIDAICGAYAAGERSDEIVAIMDVGFDQSLYEFDAATYTYAVAYSSCPEYLEVLP